MTKKGHKNDRYHCTTNTLYENVSYFLKLEAVKISVQYVTPALTARNMTNRNFFLLSFPKHIIFRWSPVPSPGFLNSDRQTSRMVPYCHYYIRLSRRAQLLIKHLFSFCYACIVF
jgi:hypothetical protein